MRDNIYMFKNGFFESPLYKFGTRLVDVLALNFLWLFCSLPLLLALAFPKWLGLFWIPCGIIGAFTMGAASVAAFSITLKMVDDEEGYIFKPFFKEFKASFFKGGIAGMIQTFAVYALYLDFQLFNNVKDSNIMFLIVFILGLILLFTHYVYAYALMGRYENTVINTLRNSFTISLRYFKKTILIFLVVVFEILLFVWSGTTEFIGLIIGPVCIMFTISGMAKPIFLRIEKDNSGSDDEEEETEEDVDVSEYETIDYEKLAQRAKKNE